MVRDGPKGETLETPSIHPVNIPNETNKERREPIERIQQTIGHRLLLIKYIEQDKKSLKTVPTSPYLWLG